MVTHIETHSPETDANKLAELIKNIEFAMLTTVEADGTLRSRPMATQKVPFDGTLWFFTRVDSGKVEEVERESHVSLSYADPKSQKYVSVSGIGRISQDPAKAKALWHDDLKVWFPGGVTDPTVALLAVTVKEAEYWDAPSGVVRKLIGMVARATGMGGVKGEHASLRLS